MTTPPVSFVAHAQSHEAHNHYPANTGAMMPRTTMPPSTAPGNNPAIGPPPTPPGPGPAATVTISPTAQVAAQTLPPTPSTETPLSPAPGSQAYDAAGALTASHEAGEGGTIQMRG